jgi:hypothetical protein
VIIAKKRIGNDIGRKKFMKRPASPSLNLFFHIALQIYQRKKTIENIEEYHTL